MNARELEILWISDGREPPEIGFPADVPRIDLRLVHLRPDDDTAAGDSEDDAPSPEVVLLDLEDLDEIRSLRRITAYSQRFLAPLVTVGGPSEPAFLLESAAAGAVATLSRDPAPDVLGARVLLVVESSETNRELRRGYAAFRSIFDDLDFGILLASPEGIVLRANRALHEILGYRSLGLAGRRLATLTHSDDQDTLGLFAELVRGERDRYVVRQRFIGEDGRTVWLDLSANRVDEPFVGEPFLVLKLIDATREIHTRLRLDETERHYRTLFERNPVPTYVLCNERLRILDANPAATASLGYSRQDLLRLGPEALWTPTGESGSAARDLLGHEVDIGPVRVRQRRRDGSLLEGELRAVSIHHRGRRAHLVLVRDVGESLRLEEALARARQAVVVRRMTDEVTASLVGVVERLDERVEALRRALREGHEVGREVDRLEAEVTATAGIARRFTEQGPPPPAEDRGNRTRVLLVDDDPAVRFLIAEMLDMEGHRVVEAESGEAALSAYDDQGPFDLVVADATLPDLRGTDLVRELRRRTPSLRALIVSGYLDEALTARGVLGPDLPFLAKPFSTADFRAKVGEVLGSSPG